MTAESTRMHTSTRRPLYRSRHGWIFGVVRGLCDYAQISPGWMRLILIVLTVLTGGGALLVLLPLYIVAAIFMKPEPILEPKTEDDLEFYNAYASSRSMGLARLKRRLEQLERRTRRMENAVTAREYDWDQRLKDA